MKEEMIRPFFSHGHPTLLHFHYFNQTALFLNATAELMHGGLGLGRKKKEVAAAAVEIHSITI